MTTTRPWDRTDQETPAAYRAFLLYLRGGAERSGMKVYQQINGGSLTTIYRWSRTFNWAERVKAWEDNGCPQVS